jgi:hypothetical protein
MFIADWYCIAEQRKALVTEENKDTGMKLLADHILMEGTNEQSYNSQFELTWQRYILRKH